jgi:NitT/TauT family transport system ATP-binding protein
LTAILSIKNIVKNFKNGSVIRAIDDVSFDVNPNEFICIVGPSGCGKSTLLRIIAGLETADSGQILFQGVPTSGPSPKITMVFQTFGLLPWKTAEQNVQLPMEVVGMNKQEAVQRANRYLRMVGLGEFEKAYPHDMSGGMRQRVGVARALALGPEVLLLDEPFSALDELTAKSLRILLLKIWGDPSLPTNNFVMVTHNVEEAVMMADRIIVMSPRPGRVVGELQVPLPRPRFDHLRDPDFFQTVDKLLGMLSSTTQEEM